ncbi:hypothetical protein N8T08_000653 [Aspergillus melleus]|uniref:Uncharacterized protein n=1 Tax=Aspergillus melleus TaxID=138277 RepID=A0ACC3APT9_9EURO|nr:hypothetical protein N8T08_000653 [Aspergillus melleus]
MSSLSCGDSLTISSVNTTTIEVYVGSNSTLARGMHDNPSRRKPGSEWFFEERECSLAPTSMSLVRIMVGKVVDGNRLVDKANQAGTVSSG